MSEPMLYNVKAFCSAHGMGKSRCYDLIKAGKIAAVLDNGRIRITREAAAAWRQSWQPYNPTNPYVETNVGSE